MDIARIAPRIKLSLQSQSGQDSAVFGSGVAQLCRGVEQWGSLNRAAKEMNMAYSKAWRIMKHTETSFGIQLLRAQRRARFGPHLRRGPAPSCL